MSWFKLALPTIAAVLAACSGDLGVVAVQVHMAPMAIEDLPDGLDPLEPADWMHCQGMVDVDVPAGFGAIDASDLPEVPDEFEYVVDLSFIDEPREDLAGGGHDHGDADDHFETVTVGPLQSVGDETWAMVFAAADVGAHELGALRAAKVVLVPIEARRTGIHPVVVMHGEAEIEVSEEDGHAHSHGV